MLSSKQGVATVLFQLTLEFSESDYTTWQGGFCLQLYLLSIASFIKLAKMLALSTSVLVVIVLSETFQYSLAQKPVAMQLAVSPMSCLATLFFLQIWPVCTCPSGYVLNKSKMCCPASYYCPAGKHWNTDLCKCQCLPYYRCPRGKAWNRAWCKCVDDDPFPPCDDFADGGIRKPVRICHWRETLNYEHRHSYSLHM